MTDTVSQLAERVARLETIERARGLIADYAEAVDRQNLAALARVFGPEAVLTTPGRTFEGITAITEFYRTTFADDPSARRHFVTNVRVDDASSTTASFTSYFLYTAGTRGESVLGWGRYTDLFAYLDADRCELRLASKHIEIDHRGPVAATWADHR